MKSSALTDANIFLEDFDIKLQENKTEIYNMSAEYCYWDQDHQISAYRRLPASMMDNELNPLSQQWMNPESFKFYVKIELKCPAGYSEQIQQAKKETGDVFEKKSFLKFFDTALTSDLKIRVKDRIFFAHSIILMEASEVLSQKINQSLNILDPMGVLEFDCDPELFEHILRWVGLHRSLCSWKFG